LPRFQRIWVPSHGPPIEVSIKGTMDVKRDQRQPFRSHNLAESIPASQLATNLFNAFPLS
jgi:hypothetical protein